MPAHALADIQAAAAAALRDPQMRGVQWNFGGSVEPVSAFLDLEHDDAMVFILEQIALLTEADLCETLTAREPHVDVYAHTARRSDWYVKLGLRRAVLYVVSFHPPTHPMRRLASRVKV